jgi:hypothetical protein
MSTVKAVQTAPVLTDIDAHRGPTQPHELTQPHEEMSKGQIISAAEHTELEALVEIVESGLDDVKQSFVAIGEALAEIRDRGLWKTHKTFVSFAQSRFGLKRSSTYNYIRAAEFVQRAGHLVPAPASLRAALAKKQKAAETKKAVTLEAGKPKLAPGLPLPAFAASSRDPPLTADETRHLEFLLALAKYLEPVAPNRKIEELKVTMGEGSTLLLGDLAEPFEVMPLPPTMDLMGCKRSA